MIDRPLDRRQLWLLVGVAFALRAFVAILTPAPAEDGANYLWMAQQFARGDAARALDEVFPPLWPLVATPLVSLGDAFRFGQFAAVIVGALSVWPAARIVERLAPGYAVAVGWLLVTAPLPVRFAAECYSEPVFHLVGATAVLLGLRERWLWCGLLAGAAAWARPEGLLIAVAFFVVRPSRAWLTVVLATLVLLALAGWRVSEGHGFALWPKLDFNLARGDAAWSDDGFHIDRLAKHAMAVPWLWVEALGIPGLLAIVGLFAARRRLELRFLYVLLALGVMVVVLFLPRRRFLVSWLFGVAPFVAFGLQQLPDRARFPVWFLALLTSLLLCFRVQDEDRHSERVVGEYLATMLSSGELVTGDMTRVIWFAGMRPLPPRHFTPDELAERARAAHARFVVLGERRDTFASTVELLGAEYRSAAMPENVRQAAELRGIRVFERRD